MPRQFGKVDHTGHEAPCGTCHRRHLAGSACPPIGVWLVLTLCPTCDEHSSTYCYTHRERT